ncbi:MAG: two-component system sensor histidine kinase CreC [bacterium]|nr:two-component system sensor histidine kinase CreC [bacterium]
MKIQTRILISFFCIYIAGFYFLGDFVITDIRPRYLEAVEESLNDTAHLLASLLESEIRGDTINFSVLEKACTGVLKKKLSTKIFGLYKTRATLYVYVTDHTGMVLYDSRGLDEGKDYSQWNDVYLTLKGKYGARSSRENPDDPSTSSLYVAAPIKHNNKRVGVITVVKPTDSVTLFIELAKRNIIIAGILTCVAFIILLYILSVWISRPITQLINYVKSLKEDKRAGFPKLGRTEMRDLGIAFEELWEELRGKKYIEQYIQALTHELKSPLSSIRGAAELLGEEMPEEQKKKFYRNILTESERIEAIIQKLLELSSIESRDTLKDVEPVSIHELTSDILESFSPQLTKKNIEVIHSVDRSHSAPGERFLLRHALANLVHNAIQFTPQEGTIEISSEISDSVLSVSIRDNGEGIPVYAEDKIFDKFYSLPRKESGKKSTGLGLPFAREVASLHNGTLEVKNNPHTGVCALLSLTINN